MSKRFRKQSHTIYECKYHLIFCPKYRYRVIDGRSAAVCQRVNRKTGQAERRVRNNRDECATRPRSSGDVDTAEVFGGKRDGIFEREVSHPNRAFL